MANISRDWNKIWWEIGEFEKNERKSWKSKNPLLTEARESARMTAYVELCEKLANS